MSEREPNHRQPDSAELVRETGSACFYTIDDLPFIRTDLTRSELTVAELHDAFDRFRSSRDFFISDLTRRYSRDDLFEIAARSGCAVTRRMSSEELATFLYRSALRTFVPGDPVTDRKGLTHSEVEVAQIVAGLTDEDVRQSVAWLTQSAGYRWPANRLSIEQTRELQRLSNETKKPVNQLIREAVEQYTNACLAKSTDS